MLLELLCLSEATTLCDSSGSFVGYRFRAVLGFLVLDAETGARRGMVQSRIRVSLSANLR
jgi:hypothetical protein